MTSEVAKVKPGTSDPHVSLVEIALGLKQRSTGEEQRKSVQTIALQTPAGRSVEYKQ